LFTCPFHVSTLAGKYLTIIFLPRMEKRRKQLVAPRALQEHIRNKLIGNEKRKPDKIERKMEPGMAKVCRKM